MHQYVVGLLGAGVQTCLARNASAAAADDDDGDAAAAAALSWDLAWAYYAGAREGEDGTGSGKGPYALGDKRCPQFGTCVSNGLAANNEAARAAWEVPRRLVVPPRRVRRSAPASH